MKMNVELHVNGHGGIEMDTWTNYQLLEFSIALPLDECSSNSKS